MIDPRFANTGAVPFVPGYGAQQVPTQYHHHRHHRHHKHKSRNDESPVSRDESIHKVDHSQPHYFYQNDGVPFGSGYGVPYGAAAGFYPQQQQQQQQQQFGVANFGYANQFQGVPYGQSPFAVDPAGKKVKHHRRHHHHHRHHTTEAAGAAAAAAADQAQAVPEQLIGQRSSSVVGNEQQQQQQQQVYSSGSQAEGEADGGQPTHGRKHHRHHHHHHHHHSGEQASFEQTHQSRQTQYHTTAGADGYGHINDELIFIERGGSSPHRQEPPPGYEYKGKIEVQGLDKEYHSQSHGQGTVIPPTVAPPPSLGPCPPGWQQMVLTGGSCGPCPPGGIPYAGQLVGGAGIAQTGIGGYSSGSGFTSFGGNVSLPPNCQIVADYIFGSSSGGIISSGGYQQTSNIGVSEQSQGQQEETYVSGRPTIIEVWQKRAKSEIQERSRSTSRHRTQTPTGVSFDFERFRADILAALERILSRGGPTEVQGRDGGTQTQIHPSTGGETRIIETRHESAGEVRVIVQPIQPVFYMPRQTAAATTPQIGPVPVVQQQTSSAPNVIYIPRNVYVPVIKPVFVPRERVIIRPQVIHVARPVLVDRPVPVTQRPIIIDRERPVPVPVRVGQAAAAQGGGSKVVREEYVYRDNLPVAYGGRCAEFAGGVNYGYVPAQQQQQQQQYASSSTHEASSIYQTEGQAVNVGQLNQEVLQQTYGQGVNVGQFNQEVLQQTYGQGVNVGQLNQEVLQQTFEQSAQLGGGSSYDATQIEVLDAAVNPFWQKTDQSTLVRRYGRPAYEIVHKSKEVEQQMYSELRQRASSSIARSASTVSYASGSGIGINTGGIAQY